MQNLASRDSQRGDVLGAEWRRSYSGIRYGDGSYRIIVS